MEASPGNAAAAPPQPSAAGPSGNLAMVVDKRPPHRPGGCVGIFFQLFDWNRRLAKKRFFSRKLLPQDRAKRISKKFASEERMPPATKPAAIAAENRGGFLNAKKVDTEAPIRPSVHNSDREKRMIPPSLVARLMGLESMPAAGRLDKPRKAAVDDVSSSSDGRCHIDHSGATLSSPCVQTKLGLERGSTGHGKLQLRPQRLQKLGFFDRRPGATARAGSDTLLFSKGGMLARSRKQNYKLASPVKSPRVTGRRSSVRLMEAATRILEPGLQSRNRTRCALTYMAPLQANVEGMEATPLQRPNVSAPLVSPCLNCGSLVEVPDLRLKAHEPPSTEYRTSSTCSDFSSGSSQSGFDESVPNPPVIPREMKRSPSLAVQAKANVQSRSHYFVERRSHSQNELQEHNKPQSDEVGSLSALKQNNSRRNDMPFVREKAAPASRLSTRPRVKRESSSFNEAKDFIALNRNVNHCARAKTTKAMVHQRIEMERNAWERKPLVCKGKSIGNTYNTENIAAINSVFPTKKTLANSVPNGKGPTLITARSIHGNPVKCEIQRLGGGKCGSGSKIAGIHSLAGNAGPEGNSSMPRASVTKRRNGVEESISECGPLSSESNPGKLSTESVLDKRINALSVLLEEKIQELTCLDLQKSESGDGALKSRPTAAILEELISALSAARSMSLKKEDDSVFGSGMQDESSYAGKGPSGCTNSCVPRLGTFQSYQAGAKSGVLAGVLQTSDYEQHSPMSILEASFSNESCLSESFNSSSGHRPHIECTERSFDKLLSRDPDTDLSDSAMSSNIRGVGPVKSPYFLDNNMNSRRVGSFGSKINYFREVIVNAELLFGNNSLNVPYGVLYASIDPILLDALETLVDALRGVRNCHLNYSEDKDGLQFRSFLFDYIIEHLDVKYGHFSKTGYKAWAKMPLLTGDRLALDIYEEIMDCRDRGGEILDEILWKEMSRVDWVWMDFQVEVFEAGAEIGNDLLQLLVDEAVVDLLRC